MFAETYIPVFFPGGRVFQIFINRNWYADIDVFLSVGENKPLYIKYQNIEPVEGKVNVTIKRINGKQNPMISGLALTASSLVPDETPPPVSDSDPTCKTGIYAKNVNTGQRACCEKVCGKCGGKGCSIFKQGHRCCISNVSALKRSCDTYSPPCIPSSDIAESEPFQAKYQCKVGILGYNKSTKKAACCETSCGQCGGNGCGKAGKFCCISSVASLSKSCDSHSPPCIPTKSHSVSHSGKQACSMSGATPNLFRLNVGGDPILAAKVGGDNINYISSKENGEINSLPSSDISASSGPSTWDSIYSSHRWTRSTVLQYTIPVQSGDYAVKLLFAEIYFGNVGARIFDIYINGVLKKSNLDVYKEVGKHVGLILNYPKVSAVRGNIQITLIHVLENPMISGIFIEGPGAGATARGGGCDSSYMKMIAEQTNIEHDHRSHSVPGGPYVVTDFDKDGFASVSLDGRNSHSHYSDPGPPEVSGKIVSYKWAWTEAINGKDVKRIHTDKSGTFSAEFPLGETEISLEVVDTTGDVALDSGVVQVLDSTQDGVYCYYYDYENKIMNSVPVHDVKEPSHGESFSSINFQSLEQFGDFPFKSNSFMMRCEFFINIPAEGSYSYSIVHGGPFKMLHMGSLLSQSTEKGTTASPNMNFKAGLHFFQMLYSHDKTSSAQLVLKYGSVPLSSDSFKYDISAVLPAITSLSESTSTPSGGNNIQIFGSGFNNAEVKFGYVKATSVISSDATKLQVTVPPGSGTVYVTISTNAGFSNAVAFKYDSSDTLQQPVIFEEKRVTNADGSNFKISHITAAKYGPDGRLYLGSYQQGKLYALSINADLVVTAKCERSIGSERGILGLTFSPFTNALKMYFTSNTLYWKNRKDLYTFEEGWTNAKIEMIEWSSKYLKDNQYLGQSCSGQASDVVTGLPVSHHDHGVSKLQFLPDGTLLIAVGGTTNGGISTPGRKPVPGDAEDKLGGVASNPLSAAIISCPVDKVTHIKYSNADDPEKSKITSGHACKVYASGLRNSFGMTLHTNGFLYATDNGPNAGFGDFSANCFGGKKASENIADKLFLIEKGKFHGHPNLNRKECIHYPRWAVKPLVNDLQSSANGVIEYRSNTFGGELKGNLFVSKFAGQHSGYIAQIKLKEGGGKKGVDCVPNFLGYSGLSLVEGPRGELIMPRVYQSEILVAKATYKNPTVTFMVGVHPKQGPATGGTKILISGHNFGLMPSASFGGKLCTMINVINDNSFTCITPAGSKNQQVDVVVEGEKGRSPNYGSDYWYF